MNTKKDYVRASKIVQEYHNMAPTIGRDVDGEDIVNATRAQAAEDAFVIFFDDDKSNFDAVRFRSACKPKK